VSKPLRFATFLSPNVKPLYEAAVSRMAQATHTSIELVNGTSYQEFFQGEFEGAFVCGLPYILMTRMDEPSMELIGAPVLSEDRYEDRPVYFSDVIVKADSPFQTFEDLKGASWAFNERLSHSGYGVVRNHLVSLGETGGYFSKVVEAGYHLRSISLVAQGRVDASAIDSQVLEIEMARDPSLNQKIRIIDAIGPSTIQPVVIRKDVPESVKHAVRESLWTLHSDESATKALEQTNVQRFEEIDDSHYDDLRRMLNAVESSGMKDFGPPSG
jgi:phosphonate transport system substrate-binding protein